MHHDEAVERFYTSRAWRKCRIAVRKEHGGLCQVCISKGLIEPAVEVHHIIPLTADNVNDPRIALDSRNLMALCDACHEEQHKKKRWRCEPNGHVEI